MTRSAARAEECAPPAQTPRWWTCSTPTRCAQRSTEAPPEVVVHELTALPDRIDFRKEETYAGHQPRPDRGHAQPDRRRADRRREALGLPEHRVRLPHGR